VALHYNHFKKHPDAKADDFPIVDAQKVAEDIFGQKEKTASEFKSELFSSFQSEETSPKFARYLEAGPHKEAYEKIIKTEAVYDFPMSEKGVYEKSANYIRDLKKTAENTQARAQDADYNTTRAFGAILEKFAKAPESRTSFEEFESQAYSTYGERVNAQLDLLHKAGHLKEARGKHDAGYTMFTPCPELGLLDNFLKLAQELPGLKKEAQDAEYNYNFEKSHLDETFALRGCELKKKAADAEALSPLERLEVQMNKEAASIADIPESDPVLARVKLTKLAELSKERERIKTANDFIDSAMDAARGEGKPGMSATTNTDFDNRDRSFLLQELATTDPILSKIPTKHVVDSYQQLMRIAPEISKEKDMVRSYLRQATAAQGVDPFQGQQLIDANTKLLKQRQLQQGINPGSDKRD
jgi:hypothetical protein